MKLNELLEYYNELKEMLSDPNIKLTLDKRSILKEALREAMFPKGFRRHQPGACVLAAAHATRFLLSKGIKNFEVVEGFVALHPDDGPKWWHPHTWIEFPPRKGETEPRRFDPTKKQWKQMNADPKGVQVKEIVKRYTPEQFSKFKISNYDFPRGTLKERLEHNFKWWIDPRGRFHDVAEIGYEEWAKRLISKIHGYDHALLIMVSKSPDLPYEYLYENGWIRATYFNHRGVPYFSIIHGDEEPNQDIMRAVMEKAKELGVHRVTDETTGKTIPLQEGLSPEQEREKEIQVKAFISQLNDENILISVAKYDEFPQASYVQVDAIYNNKNTFSSNPEDMNRWGYQMPTSKQLLTLPMGRYKLSDAKKLLQRMLNENMSYKELLDLTAKTPRSPDDNTNRIDRSKNVRVRSIPISMDREGKREQWNFRYKSSPETTVTDEPFQGRITFLKGEVGPDDDTNELECEVDCSCPDYMYRFAANNASAGAGAIGRDALNKAINRKPKPAYDLGEGLCKHLCALSKNLQTKITNTGKSNLFEAVNDVASKGPFNVEYYDD